MWGRQKVAGVVLMDKGEKKYRYGRGRVLLQNYEERMRGKTKSGGIVIGIPDGIVMEEVRGKKYCYGRGESCCKTRGWCVNVNVNGWVKSDGYCYGRVGEKKDCYGRGTR